MRFPRVPAVGKAEGDKAEVAEERAGCEPPFLLAITVAVLGPTLSPFPLSIIGLCFLPPNLSEIKFVL